MPYSTRALPPEKKIQKNWNNFPVPLMMANSLHDTGEERPKKFHLFGWKTCTTFKALMKMTTGVCLGVCPRKVPESPDADLDADAALNHIGNYMWFITM